MLSNKDDPEFVAAVADYEAEKSQDERDLVSGRPARPKGVTSAA